MNNNPLTHRNLNILKLIVEEYIKTGELVWSKSLLSKYELWVSAATIRNDMAKLEKLELVFQPYNSSGRYPTSKGLRVYINYMMEEQPGYFLASQSHIQGEWFENLDNAIYNIVYDLSKKTGEIWFLVVPELWTCRYSGLAGFIEKNQKGLWESALNIIKILEEKDAFITFLSSLPMSENVNIFIWEETNIPYLKDYTILIRPVKLAWKLGYVGLIGSLRMDYSFNISVVRGIL